MTEPNPNSRLETFCDGVFAIALTLLVLDIRVPPIAAITTTNELWLSLGRLHPSIFAFLLSFCIIFITWANHHATLTFVHKASSRFIYANGFMLLTVVLIPFTAALLGEYLPTGHAAPAVVLYTAVNALQALAWILLTQAALQPKPLTTSQNATQAIRNARRNGFVSLAIYTICAILAFWLPVVVALIITATWVVWLLYGIATRESLAG
jgi:uncharacterized membrane protein